MGIRGMLLVALVGCSSAAPAATSGPPRAASWWCTEGDDSWCTESQADCEARGGSCFGASTVYCYDFEDGSVCRPTYEACQADADDALINGLYTSECAAN